MNLNTYQECARRCVCLAVAPVSLPGVLALFRQASADLERAYYWRKGGGLLLLQSCSKKSLKSALLRIRSYPRAFLPIIGAENKPDRFSLPPYRVCSDPSIWPASGYHNKDFDDFVEMQPAPPSTATLETLMLNQDSVAAQMQALVCTTSLTHASRLVRFTFADSLLEVLDAVRPGTTVYPFGSAINGLGTHISDLDIVIDLGLKIPPQLREFSQLYSKEVINFHQNSSTRGLVIMQDLLGYHGQTNYHTLTPIRLLLNRLDPLSATGSRVLPGRTPIINFGRHRCLGLGIDISHNAGSGQTTRDVLHAAYWMRSLANQVPVFPFLVNTLKYLMRGAGITHHGPSFGFTNYKLIALLVSFLQTSVSQAPALEYLLLDDEKSIPENLFIPLEDQLHCPSEAPELLREFFVFLRCLDPQQSMLCLRSGRILPRLQGKSSEQFLHLPNPLLPERNITHGIDANLWRDLLTASVFMEQELDLTSKGRSPTKSSTPWGLPALVKPNGRLHSDCVNQSQQEYK